MPVNCHLRPQSSPNISPAKSRFCVPQKIQGYAPFLLARFASNSFCKNSSVCSANSMLKCKLAISKVHKRSILVPSDVSLSQPVGIPTKIQKTNTTPTRRTPPIRYTIIIIGCSIICMNAWRMALTHRYQGITFVFT